MYLLHLIAVFLAAGLAYGQLPNIPQCALQCFVTALTQDGCSQLTDFACHCQKPQLVGSVTPCVQQNCPDINQQASVSNVVVSQCSQVGHPISVPPVKPTTTTAATTTAAPTGATTPSPSPSPPKTTPIPTASVPPPPSSPAVPPGPPSPMPPHPSAPPTNTDAGATGTTAGGGPVYTGAAASWENNVAGAVVAAAAAVYIL